MILLCHAARGPAGSEWSQREFRGRDLVVFVERYHGAFYDEALVPEQSTHCSAIRFVLGGPLVADGPARAVDLRLGDALVCPSPGISPFRSLSETTTVLNIGWRRGGALGPGIALETKFRPRSTTRGKLLALAASLRPAACTREQEQEQVAENAVRDALAALRAEGLPFPADDVIAEACARRTKESDVARVLSLATSSLSTQPSSVDAATMLDVGAYHSLRRIKNFLREFHLSSVSGWRDYLQTRRLQLGVAFMGRRDARTEEVARALGFRSPTSFCHAFRSAGLPSPREVQRLLLAV